jgi:copper resistance protein D
VSPLGISLRAVHLGSGLLLVGIVAVSLLAGRSDKPTARLWHAGLARWTRGLAVLVVLSGVAVLGYQTTVATGRAGAALEISAWLRLLESTQFGTVWLLRHGLLLLLAALVLFREDDESRPDWLAWRLEAWLLAMIGMGAAAWAGHAVGVDPGSALPALVDALHLLCAGLWLGALAPLAMLCRAASREDGADARPFAVLTARRFSSCALIVMLAVIATGIWNTWNQAGDTGSLLGTRYGRLVLLKVALLIPILALAGWSRSRLLPRLGGEAATVGRPAMRRLAGFVAAEAVLGLAILAVAALLAVTPPGRHETPLWPFRFRLAPEVTWSLPGVRTQVLIGAQIVLAGLLALVAGALMRRWRPLLLSGAAILLAAGLQQALPPMAVDAYPTTYRRPSVPYTAISVTHGAALYRTHCVGCHGPAGRGDGPAAAGLPKRPADLTAPHTNEHTAGDLFWWLSHGVGAVMPGFGAQLAEEDRWDLINFLRALSASEQARSLIDVAAPDRRFVAPDFTFATGPARGSLREYRGRQPVLLVLFSLPYSRGRMNQLGESYGQLQAFNAAVIAVPVAGRERVLTHLGPTPPIFFPVVTEGATDIVTTYGLFRRTQSPASALSDPPLPRHMEFLIDRSGYLRARWIPGGGRPGWADIKVLLAELQALNQEVVAGTPPDEHVH